VARAKAEILVSGNPGCLLQITKEMRDRGQPIRALHFIEVIDASIRGVTKL
jgi:glycolate oxidase iron-sulfur subunit